MRRRGRHGAIGAIGALVAALLATALVTTTMVTTAGPAGATAAELTAVPSSGLSFPVIAITPAGTFKGRSTEGVESFLGVRYAQAPVGALRWKPPVRAPRASGIVDATTWSPRCAAPKDTNGPEVTNEDCLFLDVQRPAFTLPISRRPVLVWIHGGSNLTGGADQHDGALIARQTGAIVVTMNYRLGALGFLAHPALTAESGESGNYGFQDQQAALRWVHDNIRALGGDPAKVTIGGESSGGLDVCGHLTSPASKGLFRAAIIQSGACASASLGTAQARGQAVANAVGCADAATAAACLRAVPVRQLLPQFPTTSPPPLVRDTPTFPVAPRLAIRTGQYARVPMLVGGNLDDGRTFTADFVGWTKEQYTAVVQLIFGASALDVLARYPWPANADKFTGAYLFASILTDSDRLVGVGACLNRRLVDDLSSTTTVYGYEFAHRTGPGLRPEPAGYVWGAGHAAELPYLWPSFDNGTPIAPTFSAGERRLSSAMVQAWGRFVSDTRPSSSRLPRWPSFNDTHTLMSLDVDRQSKTITEAEFSAVHQCGFWDPSNTDAS